MERPLTWRHARADTSNFDRGLLPADADAFLDLRALRSVSAYGMVAMACLVAHNDRLLFPTTVLAPLDRVAATEMATCGFGFVVHEFLCRVEGRFDELDAALAARRSTPSRTIWCPEPGGDLVLAINPVHDEAEEDAAVQALGAGLLDVARAERIELVTEVLRAMGENRRRHAGAFDVYVAARLVNGGGDLAVEIAVGDVGVGLRRSVASVLERPIADDAEAVDAVLGGWVALPARGTPTCPPSRSSPLPWSAAAARTIEERPSDDDHAHDDQVPAARRAPVTGGGSLSRLFSQVVAAGGMVVVRSGTARHGLFATGTTRAVVPALRGTIVACTVPVGRATRMRQRRQAAPAALTPPS